MLVLTASGSVSDYSDSAKSSLEQKIGAAAGDDKLPVIIAITAASVIITATIAVPASTTAAAVKASLSSTLRTADAASSALGISVEGVPTITIIVPRLSIHVPPGRTDDCSDSGASIRRRRLSCQAESSSSNLGGFILGGATVLVCACLLVAYKNRACKFMMMLRRQQDNKGLFRFSLWGPPQLSTGNRAVTAPETQLGGTPDGGRPYVSRLKMGTV